MTSGRIVADWIAADWGTSNLRVWAMAADGTPRAEAGSDEGMGRLAPGEFEPALLRLIASWLDGRRVPVIACGMVGARQGWIEARYRAVPCTAVDAAAMIAAPTQDPQISVRIAPGLSQAQPPDVMRGEETQIAGALALHPGFDGVLCLPGTHCKWVHVSAGEVVSFQTFMTGELFDLIARQSVLRHGMQGEGDDDQAFDTAVADTLSRPEKIGARLFSLRAEGLLTGLAPATARARLSGLLIGMELAAARPYWLGQPVALIGSPRLSAAYSRALAAQGVQALILDGTACTLAGLTSLYRQEAAR
jgi:2-dehydro-3-deoxygalactonokinase